MPDDDLFLSCPYVETNILFFVDSIRFCCIPAKGIFDKIDVICEYSGGELPLDLIGERRNEMRAKFAEIEKHAEMRCNGCVFLTKKQWSDSGVFSNVVFYHNHTCNLRCNYCAAEFEGRNISLKKYYDLLPVARQLIDRRLLASSPFIYWSGGEPSIMKDFDEALTLMVEHGASNEVVTNAVELSRAVIFHLENKSAIRVTTSVDSGTAQTFLRMKGRDCYERVWRNLERYAATGGDVVVKYILCEDNVSRADLEGFVRRVKASRLATIYIDVSHFSQPDIVYGRLVDAASHPYKALAADGRCVVVGANSSAVFPLFREKTLSYTG